MTFKARLMPLLMPRIAAILSSDALASTRHFIGEVKAKLSGNWPTLDVYLHANDPYSFMLLQVLPELGKRYNVQIKLFWLGDLQDDMFPEPKLLENYAYQDAQYLADLYGLESLPNHSPDTQMALAAACQLQKINTESDLTSNDIIQRSLAALKCYWKGDTPPALPNEESTEQQNLLQNNSHRQKQQGHYLPATIKFAGEWYWGIDRLDHLEKRLNKLGLYRELETIKYNKTWQIPELQNTPNIQNYPDLQNNKFSNTQTEISDHKKTLTLYWSARSPYSYLALMRTAKLADKYALNLIIKPVMPMMMRNMLVPKTKKMYIFHDTKREAKKFGIPYGKVADPLGNAVMRCYSLLDYSREESKYLPFLLSFAQAVNSEGIRAETDSGLKVIVERAGLSWQRAKQELSNDSWKAETQQNLQEMNNQGLWGVPAIQYGDIMFWGQDRLGRIEAEICRSD